MLLFFYQALLHLYALISLPKLLWRGKGRSLASWFGKDFPHIKPKKSLRIWIHAVSVGEAKAAAPLVRKYREVYPHCEIIFSSITATGHAEVKRGIPEVDYPIYLPLDLSYIIRPIVRKIDPDLFLLCETDYWLTLMDEVKRKGARVVVINGKVSARSANRYGKLGPFTKRLFSLVDHFCLQDETYYARLASLGIPPERLTVTGNLKYESPPKRLNSEGLARFAESLKLAGPVITIGSTHPGEEEILLDALAQVPATLLLVPRHPHRFDEVDSLLKSRGLSYGRYSQKERLTGTEQVILIDAMGVLSICYQLSQASIVAGSFVPNIGGHNILEPLWCASPSLFGPYMRDQPGMVRLIHEHKAGLQLTAEELGREVRQILNGGGEELTAAGASLLVSVRGATERTWESLEGKEGVEIE